MLGNKDGKKGGMMNKKRLNNGYSHYFDRCSDCVHFKSYYFDEYDSDLWCEIFDELKEGLCSKFKVMNDDTY